MNETWTKVLKILNLSVDPKLTDTCKWIFITIIAIDVPAHILRNGATQIISILQKIISLFPVEKRHQKLRK